jgi:hypothetical protein
MQESYVPFIVAVTRNKSCPELANFFPWSLEIKENSLFQKVIKALLSTLTYVGWPPLPVGVVANQLLVASEKPQ